MTTRTTYKIKLYELWVDNQNLYARDYAKILGCRAEYVRRLAREYSLKLKPAPRLNFKYLGIEK